MFCQTEFDPFRRELSIPPKTQKKYMSTQWTQRIRCSSHPTWTMHRKARRVPPRVLGNICMVPSSYGWSTQGTCRAHTQSEPQSQTHTATSPPLLQTESQGHVIIDSSPRGRWIHQRNKESNLGIQP